uniref:Uncharacterized protein n=1 Tax=Strigamia maritima TaxID=126957 RepID=T1ISU8_STRMM
MRLVQLKTKKLSNNFDSIINLGCGPNFVLNRLELFEAMLSEQGLPFWFRFWLTFIYHPGCEDLMAIQRQWPEMMIQVNTALHRLFIQSPPQDVFQYCIDIIKLIGLIPTPAFKLPVMKKKSKSSHKKLNYKRVSTHSFTQALQQVFIKCSEMAFACALCNLFYEWLGAKNVDDATHAYWSIPKMYLDLNFKPGTLEMFLVNEWKEQLLPLLGVAQYEVPWIRNSLTGNIDHIRIHNSNNKITKLEDLKQIAMLLSVKRNERRRAIQNVDEKLNRIDIDGVVNPHCCCNSKNDTQTENKICVDHEFALKGSRSKLLNKD